MFCQLEMSGIQNLVNTLLYMVFVKYEVWVKKFLNVFKRMFYFFAHLFDVFKSSSLRQGSTVHCSYCFVPSKTLGQNRSQKYV